MLLSLSKKTSLSNKHIVHAVTWTGIYCSYLFPDFNLHCIRLPKLAPLITDYWAFNDPQKSRMVLSRLAVCEMFVKSLIATKCCLLCFIIQSRPAQWSEGRRNTISTALTPVFKQIRLFSLIILLGSQYRFTMLMLE